MANKIRRWLAAEAGVEFGAPNLEAFTLQTWDPQLSRDKVGGEGLAFGGEGGGLSNKRFF